MKRRILLPLGLMLLLAACTQVAPDLGTAPGEDIPLNTAALPDSYFEIEVSSADDAASGGSDCTLRDALGIANAGATSGNGCTVTPVGSSPGSNYVLQLPAYTYTLATAQLTKGNNNVYIRGAGTSATIIQAAASPNSEVGRRVLGIAGGGIAELADLTIRHGDLGTASSQDGGGITLGFFSTLRLENVVVTQNRAEYGGGISGGFVGGTVTINNSTISDNQAKTGGGFFASATTNTITNSTISGNSATAGTIASLKTGGGIYISMNGTTTVGGSTVTGNNAAYGGGIFVQAGAAHSISESNITNNSASVQGGGLHISRGAVRVDRGTIATNSAGNGGGGIQVGDQVQSVAGMNAELQLSNSTVASNTAAGTPSSGGVFIYAPPSSDVSFTANITNSTLALNNGGSLEGDSLYVNAGGQLTLNNTIVQGTDPNGCHVSATASVIGSHNVSTCAGSYVDPLLGALQDNGGPTLTMAPGAGSPAIDAGSDTVCAASPINNVDQRGETRPIDGDGNGTATCDIGAFEAPPVPSNTNIPPTVEAGEPYSGDEGSGISMNAATATDPDSDPLTYSWSVNSALCSFSDTSVANPILTCYDDGSFIVTLSVNDAVNSAVTDDAVVTVSNVAPTISLSGEPSVNEGSSYTLSLGTVTDPGQDTVTQYIVNWGDDSTPETFESDGEVTHTYADGPTSPTITVDLVDEDDTHVGAGSQSVTVSNVAPNISSFTLSIDGDPVSTITVGQTVGAAGSFTDPGVRDSHTAEIDWGDGDSSPVDPATSPVSGSHTFTASGSLTISLTVTDSDSDAESSVMLTVQSPEEATSSLVSTLEETDLPKNTVKSLQSLLENAVDSMEREDFASAIDQLMSFISQVEAQRGKKITDEQADELVAAAQTVIHALQQGYE